jgi:hypothetical protein
MPFFKVLGILSIHIDTIEIAKHNPIIEESITCPFTGKSWCSLELKGFNDSVRYSIKSNQPAPGQT